jgi:hypothetical protein
MQQQQPKLIPITDPEVMQANGLPFPTVDSARWAFRHRDQNGLAPAFKRLGSRILIDVPKFHQLMDAQTA